jgi:hypothetical protein
MERTRGTKLAWLALMVLQLALPSWSVIADAHILIASPLAATHIESVPCAPGHPLDCQLCSFLRAPAQLTAAVPALPLLTESAFATPAAPARYDARPSFGFPLPRAPPALS